MNDPETLHPSGSGGVFTNPALPVLIYRAAVPRGDPDAIEATMCANRWRPDWRDGVYPFHHYHSTAHEALACTSGSAELVLGGRGGVEVQVRAGDLLVLPAGTGHDRIRQSADFLLVSAYPEGQDWDVCREAADDRTLARIAAVPLPDADPLGGVNGPLRQLWRP